MRINIRLPLLITRLVLNLSIITTVIFIILLPLSIMITLTFYNSLIPYDSITHIPLDLRHFKSGQKLASLNLSQLVESLMDDVFDIDYKNRRWFMNSNLGLFDNDFNGFHSKENSELELELEMSILICPNLRSSTITGDLLNFRMVVIDSKDMDLTHIENTMSNNRFNSGNNWLVCTDFSDYDSNNNPKDNGVFSPHLSITDGTTHVNNKNKYKYRFESFIPVFNTHMHHNQAESDMVDYKTRNWFLIPPVFRPFIPPFIYELFDFRIFIQAVEYSFNLFVDIIKFITGTSNDSVIYDSTKGDILEIKVIDKFLFSNKNIFVKKDRDSFINKLKLQGIKFVFEFNQATNFLFSKLSAPVTNSLNYYNVDTRQTDSDKKLKKGQSLVSRQIGTQGEGDILIRFKFKYLNFRYYLNKYKFTFIILFSLLFWIIACLGFWVGLLSIYYILNLIFNINDAEKGIDSNSPSNFMAKLPKTEKKKETETETDPEVKLEKQQQQQQQQQSLNLESGRGPSSNSSDNDTYLIMKNLDSLIED